jgi:hypothetical protein
MRHASNYLDLLVCYHMKLAFFQQYIEFHVVGYCKYQLFWQGLKIYLRRVWRYQRGNQNPYIEKEQTTQWPKGKVQKDKQRSTKHIYKTKDRVKRTPLTTGGERRFSGKIRSSCSTSGTRLSILYNRIDNKN